MAKAFGDMIAKRNLGFKPNEMNLCLILEAHECGILA